MELPSHTWFIFLLLISPVKGKKNSLWAQMQLDNQQTPRKDVKSSGNFAIIKRGRQVDKKKIVNPNLTFAEKVKSIVIVTVV